MGYLFGMECHAAVVSVQTHRAELLLALAGVGHEARVPRVRLAQQPKSISATCLRAFMIVYQKFGFGNDLGRVPQCRVQGPDRRLLKPLAGFAEI
jgi:hypothetical protein